MALTVQVLNFAATIAAAYQVRGIMVAQDCKCLIELILLDVAVRGQIATGRTSRDQVFPRQEGQGTGVVVVRKVYLCKPKGIGVAV